MEIDEAIEEQRIEKLNHKSFQKNKFIIYWMQASQRTKYNHALEYSIKIANRYQKPLIVFFGLTDDFPEANLRHYYFMLQGLKETKRSLNKRNINFIINHISPDKGIINLSKNACLIVVDKGYLRIQKLWRKNVAEKIKCPLIQVESEVVIPVEIASEKEEYSAFTIRKKIKNKIQNYLKPLNQIEIKKTSKIYLENMDINNIKMVTNELKIDKKIKPINDFIGGEKKAHKHLKNFLKNKIDYYPNLRNDPTKECVSNLSPYLHFGQISPIDIALQTNKFESIGKEAFLEELIVRRELSINFVNYNSSYDSYEGLPNWAKNSLKKHEKDQRDNKYSLEEFEKGETHDPYWNAAQKQMIKTGKMHGYMRMYWGKKIIEWTAKPKKAFEIAIYLNNKYELDGRDPNSFTGVAWCFGKHDRPWQERKIFGNIRYMNANGLKRKFEIDKYEKKYSNK